MGNPRETNVLLIGVFPGSFDTCGVVSPRFKSTMRQVMTTATTHVAQCQRFHDRAMAASKLTCVGVTCDFRLLDKRIQQPAGIRFSPRTLSDGCGASARRFRQLPAGHGTGVANPGRAWLFR